VFLSYNTTGMPDSPLKGRRALVTGAGLRIGKAVALALADAGADVLVHYLGSEAAARATAALIRRKGRKAWTLRADLGDPAQAAWLFEEARRKAGPVRVLVNSASVFPSNRVTGFSWEDLADSLRVNAFAPLVLCRALAAQGSGGTAVNLLDCRIQDYDREHAAYHLSKRMLFTLTRMMALEFAPKVRVNAVAPGLILPPRGKGRAYLESLRGTNPLGGLGSPRDVAEAVLFLLRSRFVTGQVLYVDGGRHMRGAVYG
jgi:pteridine reductase